MFNVCVLCTYSKEQSAIRKFCLKCKCQQYSCFLFSFQVLQQHEESSELHFEATGPCK